MSKTTLIPRRKVTEAAKPKPAKAVQPFWKTTPMAKMTEAQWESLCDNCGKCCLISLEDDETAEIYLTDVSCKLFDSQKCGCGDYLNRKQHVPDCVKLTPQNIGELDWLPKTCAYRLIYLGHDLFWWHPLVSGDAETVHRANVSVRGKTRPEGRLKMSGLMKRITQWPEPLEKEPAAKQSRSLGSASSAATKGGRRNSAGKSAHPSRRSPTEDK